MQFLPNPTVSNQTIEKGLETKLIGMKPDDFREKMQDCFEGLESNTVENVKLNRVADLSSVLREPWLEVLDSKGYTWEPQGVELIHQVFIVQPGGSDQIERTSGSCLL